MTDRELLGALTVLAVRLGLIERGQRLEVVGDPRDDVAPELAHCLAPSPPEEKHGIVLLCSRPVGHDVTHGMAAPSAHSWEHGFVGIAACGFVASPRLAGATPCRLASGHSGDHEGAARQCLNVTTLPGGYFADCRLAAGHGGDHAQGDTTWSGEAKRFADVVLTTDSPEIRCRSRDYAGNGAYRVCQLINGHDGDHRHQVAGCEPATWADEAGGEPGTVCGAPSPRHSWRPCVLRAGHGGSHSNDPTNSRA